MSPTHALSVSQSHVDFVQSVIECLRSISGTDTLQSLVQMLTSEMGFRYYALVDHNDIDPSNPDRVDIKDYPEPIAYKLFGKRHYRRDPVIRACLFAGSAFLWSDLSKIIQLDRRDHVSLEHGAREGLIEGITVPYTRLGECMGSCTFAGTRSSEHAGKYLGIAQTVGIFAFQAARRLLSPSRRLALTPRLHPRPRDCVILVGRGCSNKEIARALSLAPRTVDGYLTEARQQFGARDRTELVVSAVLAGEIGLHELRRQPE
ncbi:LuxR family transcriptional regulator [Sphingobium sp. SCG-1]|uniref:helix-turn-helix transcriptional regulator n=1 Tax=Sphingobium sp. SCG-1 TaxID=2072936 RepID=UPI000CD68EB7|nr:LuxR family transcriptional regulator [Sphingobium sp. SCG-1]AUW57518.1 LuxR family transcriptional regulator [Sphingobium sp. SCG-1]